MNARNHCGSSRMGVTTKATPAALRALLIRGLTAKKERLE